MVTFAHLNVGQLFCLEDDKTIYMKIEIAPDNRGPNAIVIEPSGTTKSFAGMICYCLSEFYVVPKSGKFVANE